MFEKLKDAPKQYRAKDQFGEDYCSALESNYRPRPIVEVLKVYYARIEE
jgi:hypothetical protein